HAEDALLGAALVLGGDPPHAGVLGLGEAAAAEGHGDDRAGLGLGGAPPPFAEPAVDDAAVGGGAAGRDGADDALADSDGDRFGGAELAFAGPLEELVGVGDVDEHDQAGLGVGGDHRGVEDDLEDPVEVEGGGERLTEPAELASHLVAGGGEGLHVGLGLGGHAVEAERELGDLVAAVDGDAGVEVAARDPFGRGREFDERAGGGAREPGGQRHGAHRRGGHHRRECPVHEGEVGGGGADAQRQEGVGGDPAAGSGPGGQGPVAPVLQDQFGVGGGGDRFEQFRVDGA